MLQVLNYLIFTAPAWNDHSHDVGLVGVPMNAFFGWPMGTGSGYAVLLDPQVNDMLKKILNICMGRIPQSPDYAKVPDTSSSGWFSPTGLKDLEGVANVG
jgi:phosphatidylserine decarboxylase